MRAVSGKPDPTIKQLVDRIIASGQMTRQEHLNLTSTLLSEQRIGEQERIQINRIFDHVQTGRLKLVD